MSIEPHISERSLVLRVGSAVIRWVFQYEHDRWLTTRHILPWALPAAVSLPQDADADFSVAVYMYEAPLIAAFRSLQGLQFMLAGEVEQRYPTATDCISFVQGPRPDDDANTRYCPILCMWVPPVSFEKTRMCSVVDSGRRQWRAELIERAAQTIGGVNIYGRLGNRPLQGFHSLEGESGNDKYLGLRDYGFYLAIERAQAEDYITEKFNDAIMAEAVPIYLGAPNASFYCISDCFVPFDHLRDVTWRNWRTEYARRKSAVLAQKAFLRSHLNVLSYFCLLVSDLSRLTRLRPITIA